jgi:hypothetical protein
MKNTHKGPAKFPPKNAVFEARRHAVLLTQERDGAVNALRHSNAVAAWLLKRWLGAEQLDCKIPIAEYAKLLGDDATTISVAYEGEGDKQMAVVTLPVAQLK